MKINVLLIEDDVRVCEIVQFYLMQTEQYDVTIVHTAENALPIVAAGTCDIILLDIMLPGMNGIEFCEEIRKKIYCPILFISCLEDDETIVKALNMGGDDYLIKPFRGAVLLARIEANLRRSQRMHRSTQNIIVRDLTLNTTLHILEKRNERIVLSPTEYELLYFLMRETDQFLTFEMIYTAVWQRPSLGDYKTLFVHIRNLRKKIEDDPSHPTYIVSHQRDGYIFKSISE